MSALCIYRLVNDNYMDNYDSDVNDDEEGIGIEMRAGARDADMSWAPGIFSHQFLE